MTSSLLVHGRIAWSDYISGQVIYETQATCTDEAEMRRKHAVCEV